MEKTQRNGLKHHCVHQFAEVPASDPDVLLRGQGHTPRAVRQGLVGGQYSGAGVFPRASASLGLYCRIFISILFEMEKNLEAM